MQEESWGPRPTLVLLILRDKLCTFKWPYPANGKIISMRTILWLVITPKRSLTKGIIQTLTKVDPIDV